MRLNRPLLMCFVVVLAGCTSPADEPTCEAEDCGPTTPPPKEFTDWPPGTPFPNLPLNESLRSIRYEGCFGAIGGIHVPSDSIREVVPLAFDPIGTLPLTYVLVFEAKWCSKVTFNDTVVNNVGEFFTFPKVTPRNESWEPEHGASFWVLDHYVSSDALAAWYGERGIPTENAVVDVEPSPTGAGGAISWEISKGNIRFSFRYSQPEASTHENDIVYFAWVGADPFLRSTVRLHDTADSVQAGVIELSGPSRTADVVGAPVVGFDCTPSLELSYSLMVDAELFKGG